MEKLILEDYINNHPFSQEIYRGDLSIRDLEIPVVVYYEDIMFAKSRSKMLLFSDGCLVARGIHFECSVDTDDMLDMAKGMVREYDEYMERTNAYVEKVVMCLGSAGVTDDDIRDILLYGSHSFTKTQLQWDKVYGLKSATHREYCHADIIDRIGKYIDVNGDDGFYMQDLIQYLRVYSGETCEHLFK